jgi:hypothetical protein
MKSKEHPLLAESLLHLLENLTSASSSPIARSLVLAHKRIAGNSEEHECKVGVSETARMIAIRKGCCDEGVPLGFSYLPKGKQPKYNENGTWTLDNRQVATPVKVARALLEDTKLVNTVNQVLYKGRKCNYDPIMKIISYRLKDKQEYIALTDEEAAEYEGTIRSQNIPVKRYSDSLYEKFANDIKGSLESDLEFKLVSGKDIPWYYASQNYYDPDGSEEGGTLWQSCMRDMSADTFDLYVDCKNCQLLVAMKDGFVIGRALVWNTNLGIFMDRVYYYEDHHFNVFANYAMERGWMYKRTPHSASNTDIMGMANPDEDYSNLGSLTLSVEGACMYHASWPYLDTLKYITADGVITNAYNVDWVLELEDPDGIPSEDRRQEDDKVVKIHCAHTGELIDEDDATYIEDIGWVGNDYVVRGIDESDIPSWLAKEIHDGGYVRHDDPDVVQLADGRYAFDSEVAWASDGKYYLLEDVEFNETKRVWEVSNVLS